MNLKIILIGVALAGCGGIGDSQKRLRTAVDARQPTLDECYGATLARDATAQGTMEVSLHVTESGGTVDQVKITRSEVADPTLQECVKSALVGVQLAPAPKANLEVAYTLTFAPAS